MNCLIQILNELKRPEEILPRLQAAARNDPKNLPLQYLLADRYKEEGQPEKADELYRELLATQPDPQGFGALAASLVKEKRTDELIELLGKAFSKPQTLEAVKPQIEAIANDPEFCGELLDEALKLQQAEPPELSRESRLVTDLHRHEGQSARQVDSDPAACASSRIRILRLIANSGSTCTGAGSMPKPPRRSTRCSRTFPDQKDSADPGRYWRRARRWLATNGRAGGGRGSTRACILTTRKRLRLKGYLLGKLERNEEAIAHYQSMLERFPNDDEVIRLARSGLSIIYVNMEDFEKGEHELELLLERTPDDPGVNNDLGYLYADRGKNLEKAESMIRLAIAEEPENPAYLDSLGWVLFKRGKLEEALEPLEQAAKDFAAGRHDSRPSGRRLLQAEPA